MVIDTGDHPPIAQKPYTKQSQWICEELEMLEKAGIISRSVSPRYSPNIYVPERAKPGEVPQKHLWICYHALNGLLPPVVKAHLKNQGVVTLVSLPEIDDLYALLNGSTAYSILDCTSGYHCIALSPETQKK